MRDRIPGPLERLTLNLHFRWVGLVAWAFAILLLAQVWALDLPLLLLLLALGVVELGATSLFVRRENRQPPDKASSHARLVLVTAELQVVVELVMLTAAVHLTSGPLSPLLPFYLIYILFEAINSPPMALAGNAALAALLASGLFLGSYYGIIARAALPGLPGSGLAWDGHFFPVVLLAIVSCIGLAALVGYWTGRQSRSRGEALARSADALAAKQQQFAAVREIAKAFAAPLDIPTVLDVAAQGALKLIPATDAHLFLYEVRTGSFTMGAGVWADGHRGLAVPRPRAEGGLSAAVVQEGRPVVINDAENHPFYSTPLARPWAVKSIAGFPLKRGDRVLGVLNVAFLQPHAFQEEELAVLQLLADQAALAVENALISADMSARRQDLSTVYSVASAASRLDDPQALANDSLGMLVDSVHADAGILHRLEDSKGKWVLAAQRGLSPLALGEIKSNGFAVNDGLAGQAVEMEQPVATVDLAADSRNSHRFASEDGLQSLYALPLLVGERLVGVIELLWKDPHNVSAAEASLIAAVAQQIAVGVNSHALFAEASRRADQLASLRALALSSISPNPKEQMALLYEKTAQLLQPDSFLVALVDRPHQELQVQYLVEEGWSIRRRTLKLESDSPAAWVVENGRSLNLADGKFGYPAFAPPGPRPTRSISSWLGVPLALGEETVGLIAVASFRPGAFTSDDERFLVAAAQQISVTLDNARLQARSARRAKEIALLDEIARAAIAAGNLDESFERALRGLSESAGYHSVSIWLLDSGDLVYKSGTGLESVPTSITLSLGIQGRVASTNRAVLLTDVTSEPDFYPLARDVASEACVPIQKDGRVFGVIDVQEPRSVVLDEHDLLLLGSIAGQLAVTLHDREVEKRQGLLYRATREIASSSSLEQLLAAAVNSLREDFHFRDAVVFRADGSPPRFYPPARERSPIVSEMVARVAESRTTLSVADSDLANERGKGGEDPCAALALPLTTGHRMIGVLYLEHEPPHSFGRGEVRMLECIADDLAVAIDNAEAQLEAEEQRKRVKLANERLVESERRAAVGELAAGLAHEINNPLTAIVGHTQLMMQAPAGSPESLNAELMAINGAAQRITLIIKEFVRVANIETVRREVIDLRPVLQEEVAQTELEDKLPEVLIHLHVPDEPVWISGSRTLLNQVVSNVLSNSIEAMPQGGTISVNLSCDESQVTCTIKDTGVGIDPENLKRVFEPGFTTRLDTGSIRRVGMGLYTADRIVRNHNGSLSVESTRGQGTTVQLVLPRVRREPNGAGFVD